MFSQSDLDLDELLADDADKADDLDTLTAVLLGHTVGQTILSTDLTESVTSTVSTLMGNEIDLLQSGSVFTVDDAEVIEADIILSNGVVHVIDAVLE